MFHFSSHLDDGGKKSGLEIHFKSGMNSFEKIVLFLVVKVFIILFPGADQIYHLSELIWQDFCPN